MSRSPAKTARVNGAKRVSLILLSPEEVAVGDDHLSTMHVRAGQMEAVFNRMSAVVADLSVFMSQLYRRTI
jgi:hypothetical protein